MPKSVVVSCRHRAAEQKVHDWTAVHVVTRDLIKKRDRRQKTSLDQKSFTHTHSTHTHSTHTHTAHSTHSTHTHTQHTHRQHTHTHSTQSRQRTHTHTAHTHTHTHTHSNGSRFQSDSGVQLGHSGVQLSLSVDDWGRPPWVLSLRARLCTKAAAASLPIELLRSRIFTGNAPCAEKRKGDMAET